LPPCLLARRKVHLGGRSAIEEKKIGEERRRKGIDRGRGKGEDRGVGGGLERWRKKEEGRRMEMKKRRGKWWRCGGEKKEE
jgi:hypothetical protein